MEKDSNKIGNVIRIIDNRTLIVDAGKDELKVGDKVKIYESLDTLYDLDGTELCIFEYTKDTLNVIDVDNNYSVCQKQVSKQVTKQLINIGLALSPLLETTQTVYESLNVQEEDIKPLKASDPVIHLGDPVKKA